MSAKVGDRVQFTSFAEQPPEGGRTMSGEVVMLQAVVVLDREFFLAGELPVKSVALNSLTVLSDKESVK
jgi:hypothetical protein